MANRPKGRTISKKHLARVERERRQNRAILTVSAIVIAIVLILVGYGIVNQYIIRPSQPVATVGDVEISTREFQTFARYTRLQLINQYYQTQQLMQMFGGDTTNAGYFEQNLIQIESQLEPEVLGQTVLDRLIENVFIREEAERLGIVVTEEEIEQSIEESFGYYPNGTPTPAPTQATQPTSTLSPTQLVLVPPTPTTVVTDTATATPTQEPTIDPNAEPTVTPTVYTEKIYRNNYKEQISYLKGQVGLSEKDFYWVMEMNLYRQKVFDAITADLPTVEEQVWARHILVADEATAQDVLARLQNGEDFAALAQELSTDTGSGAQGGDLGWFGQGKMVAEFEEAAFSLGIGEISDPVQSQFGYHIIQVLGHEEREIAASDFEQDQQTAFQDWLSTRRVESDVQIFDYWVERVPTVPALPVSTTGL